MIQKEGIAFVRKYTLWGGTLTPVGRNIITAVVGKNAVAAFRRIIAIGRNVLNPGRQAII